MTLRESFCRSWRLPRDAQVVMGRASFLAPSDRDLVEAVLVRGQRVSAIARMTGVRPRMVRQRLSRLLRLITSREFLDAVGALAYLGQEDAALARLHFCQGLTQMELCRHLKCARHTLRRRLDRLAVRIAVMGRWRRDVTDSPGDGSWDKGMEPVGPKKVG